MKRRRNSERSPRTNRRCRRLRLEALETRRLLAAFTVTTAADVVDGNDSVTSLREAIESANGLVGPDTITFDPLAFGSAFEIDLLLGQLNITDTLTIRGPQQHPLKIDGQGNSRVIGFFSSIGDLTLQRLTVTGGRTTQDDVNSSESGGGIRFASAGTLTLNHTAVIENGTLGSGARGGGIFADPGAVVLSQSTVSRNSTSGTNARGGGIYSGMGAVSLVDSTVSGNTTLQARAKGGGIYSADGGVSLVGSFIVDNSTVGVSADGGGIFSSDGVSISSSVVTGNRTTGRDADGGAIFVNGSLTVSQSDVSYNTTQGRYAAGGAVAADSATVFINGSSITNNQTSGQFGYGAGVFAVRSNITIAGSTISGNTASGDDTDGGGISAFFSSLLVTSSTISLNATTGTGGGFAFMDNEDRTFQIRNSIVAGNSDSGVAPDLESPRSAQALTLISSLIGDNTGTPLAEALTPDSNGNLIGDPSGGGLIDAMLDTLSLVGKTRAHPLLSDSVAVDAGNNSFLASIPNDQRGEPFVRIANSFVDMGSFELQAIDPASYVVTTVTDELDFSDSQVSLREAITAANGNAGPDVISFDPSVFASTQSIVLQLGELTITESVSIDGPGRKKLSIDAEGNSRVLTVAEGSGDVTLSGLTITGGLTSVADQSGGGIRFLSGGTLTLRDSVVADNHTRGDSAKGGGIYSPAGGVTLDRSVVINNSTEGSSASGGGAYIGGGLVAVDSTIAGNATAGADAAGGGVFVQRPSGNASQMMRSTVSGNSTAGIDAHGGGIAVGNGSIKLANSTVSENRSSGDGGGIYSITGASIANHQIVSSTITANTSGGDGGGMNVGSGSSGSLVIYNSILAANTDSGSAPDMDLSRLAGDLSLESSLIGDNMGTGLAESQTPDDSGNFVGAADPGGGVIDPQLGPLAFWGGVTASHSLLSGSPAINAGDPILLGELDTDQRGAAFVRVFDRAPDIGSFESQTLDESFFVVNSRVDELDFANSEVSLREALELAAGSLGTETIRFDKTAFSQSNSIDLVLGELRISESVTIVGPGQDLLTINGHGNSRVFHVTASVADVTLEGMTVTGGKTSGDNQLIGGIPETTHSGGGIRFDAGGSLTLREVTVVGNSTTGSIARGGGIFASGGSLTLVGSTISGNNTASENADGGGIFFRGAALSLTATNVQSNSTSGSMSSGGGISASLATITIVNTAIVNNSTTGDSSDGAGVSVSDSTLKLINATLSGNSTSGSDSSGGAIDASVSSDVSIVNTTIIGNSVTGDAGGISISGGANEILSIVNSIVAGNNDSGTAPDLMPPSSPANLTLMFSLIGDNSGTTLAEAQTADAMGNLVGSISGAGIIDPMLAALAINGGTTPTHAPLAASPAIDAGDDNLAVDVASNPLASDQRQAPFSRFFGTVDIGAFETQPPREPIIQWSDPVGILEGTELSDLQLNATTNVAGAFVYTPDEGTILGLGDGQSLMVQFTPSDTIHYAQALATVKINVVEPSDHGDAPDSYATLRASNGPRHLIGSLTLGSAVDSEADGQPSADADGDGSDDDGVTLITSLVADALSGTTATLTVNASAGSKLDAWIDFNGNGVFDHPSEHIGGGMSIDLARGNNIVQVSVPVGAMPGDTFARVRISSVGGLLPTGAAADGEVEDYAVTILDGSTAPTVNFNLPSGSVTLFSDLGDLVVQRRTEDLFRASVSAVGRYEIIGDPFSNVLTIDTTGGSAIPTGGLSYDGVDRINTVRLIGANNSLDLSRDGNVSLRNIDVIDISDPAASTLSIDAGAARAMDPTGGGVIVVGGQGDSILFVDPIEWRMAPPVGVAGFSFSVVTLGDTFVQVDFASPWQNLAQASDVNNDGNVTAGDALRIINELSRRIFSDPNTAQLNNPATVSPWPNVYFDQSGDGLATALDALRVINQLAREANSGGSGEGESGEAFLHATSDRFVATLLTPTPPHVSHIELAARSRFLTIDLGERSDDSKRIAQSQTSQRSTQTRIANVDQLLADTSFFG